MTVKSRSRFKPMYGTQKDNWVLDNVTSRLSIWDVRRLFFTSELLKLVSFRLNKSLRSVNTQSIVHIRIYKKIHSILDITTLVMRNFISQAVLDTV